MMTDIKGAISGMEDRLRAVELAVTEQRTLASQRNETFFGKIDDIRKDLQNYRTELACQETEYRTNMQQQKEEIEKIKREQARIKTQMTIVIFVGATVLTGIVYFLFEILKAQVLIK